MSIDPNCKFIFYNQNKSFDYGRDVINHTICCNEQSLLENLSDKIWVRKMFANLINTIPSLETTFNEISLERLSALFPDYDEFILQKPKSGGGTGTFLCNKKNFDDYKETFANEERILVSPFIANSYSINTTLLIGEQNCLIFPSSIQIIEKNKNNFLYRGADYIAFQNLEESLKNKIYENSKKVARHIQNLGYKGIVGIDFLIQNKENVLFIELNNRFQASSDLLNYELLKHDTSLQELNLLAFQNERLPEYSLDTLLSSYFYYNENENTFDDLKFKYKSIISAKANGVLDELDLLNDGYKIDCQCSARCYGFKVNIKKQICSISPDGKLWTNENIRYVNPALINKYKTNLLSLKVALLNQGVSIDNSINKNLKNAVYRSIDINLDFNGKKVTLNCPYMINFAKISPFYIDNKYCLSYAGIPLFNVTIDELMITENLKTTSGKPISKIIYMSEDRLRIKTMSGCDYKKNHIGCDFCDNPDKCTYFDLNDIYESIKCASNIYKDRLNHFMIGGGTDFRKDYWFIVEHVIKYIHSDNSLPNEITLMVAPFEIYRLKKLKELNLNDLSVNIEIYDDTLAKQIMKGKGIERKEYFNFFEEAKKFWPDFGDLRSMVIVGIDTTDNLIKLVSKLVNMGVQPVLSIFRPLPNTPLENHSMPSNEYLENIYFICDNICKSKNRNYTLGPKCSACRNNVLSI